MKVAISITFRRAGVSFSDALNQRPFRKRNNADSLRQAPGAALGLLDPDVAQARRSDVTMVFADIVRFSETPGQPGCRRGVRQARRTARRNPHRRRQYVVCARSVRLVSGSAHEPLRVRSVMTPENLKYVLDALVGFRHAANPRKDFAAHRRELLYGSMTSSAVESPTSLSCCPTLPVSAVRASLRAGLEYRIRI